MRTLVTYFSNTGNTRKIAEAIYSALPRFKRLLNISEVESLADYSLIFVGFPVHAFCPVNQAKEFLIKYASGRNVALFATMSLTAVPASEYLQDYYKRTISNCKAIADNSNLLGIFDCPGELSKHTATDLLNSENKLLQMFGGMRDLTLGFPNDQNTSDAKKFAREIFYNFLEKYS